MSSFQDAFVCQTSGPYSTLMKVKLVSRGDVQTYRGQDGEEKKSLLVAVSDGTDCIPAKIYDEGKFTKVQVGTCLALRDVIRKNDDMRHIVLTKNTKVFITAVFPVPDGHIAIGDSSVNPAAAATLPLDKALQQHLRASSAGESFTISEENWIKKHMDC